VGETVNRKNEVLRLKAFGALDERPEVPVFLTHFHKLQHGLL